MAAALGAIKGFLLFFTNDWARQEGSPDQIVTILDVLEPTTSARLNATGSSQ